MRKFKDANWRISFVMLGQPEILPTPELLTFDLTGSIIAIRLNV